MTDPYASSKMFENKCSQRIYFLNHVGFSLMDLDFSQVRHMELQANMNRAIVMKLENVQMHSEYWPLLYDQNYIQHTENLDTGMTLAPS